MELITACLDGLGHRGADAAPLGAEQAEQSDRRPAQIAGVYLKAATLTGANSIPPPTAISIHGQTTCVGLIWRFSRASQ